MEEVPLLKKEKDHPKALQTIGVDNHPVRWLVLVLV